MPAVSSDALKRYRIRYRDQDPGCPVFSWSVRALCQESAIEMFHSGPDGEGWLMLSIERIDDDGHRIGHPTKLNVNT